jgi:outer membrane protein assembly factor BamB
MAKANLTPAILITILLLSFFFVSIELPVKAVSSGDDWPMFRCDPAHTGYTTSTATTKPVKLWSYPEGHFTGYFISSSPAVVNGIVYVGSNWDYREGYDEGNIFAFNAYTGAKIWNYSTQTSVYSSPAVSENRVFIGAGLDVLALDASRGTKIWNFTTKGFRIDSSPTVVNGVV